MSGDSETITGERNVAILRLVILLALCLWCFRDQLAYMVRTVSHSSETAHSVVMPMAVALLVYLRRNELERSLGSGSAWGIALIVLGLVMHALAYWPFPYGYAHYVSIVPVVLGTVLLCSGRRTLRLCLPMILMVWLAFPIGSRIHASLVLRPNVYTLQSTAAVLDALPGIDASVDGGDLLFTRSGHDGVVGLGEANRGARQMFVYAAIGVFVVFSRIRKTGRVVALAILALPLVLLCNLFRFFCWAMMTIYGGFGPMSPLPRDASTIISLAFAYGLFAVLCAARLELFVEEDAVGTGATSSEDRR